MHVVVALVLRQGVPKVGFVPDQYAIQQFGTQEVFTQRSMIEFMRGVRTPVNTVVIPAPARISFGCGSAGVMCDLGVRPGRMMLEGSFSLRSRY
jgi:hypothetical protein